MSDLLDKLKKGVEAAPLDAETKRDILAELEENKTDLESAREHYAKPEQQSDDVDADYKLAQFAYRLASPVFRKHKVDSEDARETRKTLCEALGGEDPE